jgi:hypothetical protein
VKRVRGYKRERAKSVNEEKENKEGCIRYGWVSRKGARRREGKFEDSAIWKFDNGEESC